MKKLRACIYTLENITHFLGVEHGVTLEKNYQKC